MLVHLYLRRPEPARQQELFFDESGCEPEPDDEHADGFSGTTHDFMTIKRGQAKKKGGICICDITMRGGNHESELIFFPLLILLPTIASNASG
jgi:hypothetical protein